MTRRPHSPRALGGSAIAALLGAFVVLVIGLALLAVLIAGLRDGVRSSGVLVLATLCIGVFALAGRLGQVALTPRRSAAATPSKAAGPMSSQPAGPMSQPAGPMSSPADAPSPTRPGATASRPAARPPAQASRPADRTRPQPRPRA